MGKQGYLLIVTEDFWLAAGSVFGVLTGDGRTCIQIQRPLGDAEMSKATQLKKYRDLIVPVLLILCSV